MNITEAAPGAGVAARAAERIAELELQLEQLKQDRDDVARMGAVLAAITDLEEILSVLMQMAMRIISAEVGLIMTTGPDGLVPKIVWGFEPRALPLLQFKDGLNVVEWVQQTGEGVLTDFFDREAGLEFEGRRLMVGGVIALPIRTQTEIVGCVVAVNKSDGGPFTEDDRNNLQILVDFAGVAIEHTRLLALSLEKQRMEQELSLAEEVQKTLVPSVDFKFPGVTLKSMYRPARKVGGDYFDIFPRGADQFIMVVGDVSNKGVPAALVMTAVRSIVRAEILRSSSTAEIVGRINELISADLTGQKDMFVTFFCGLFDLRHGQLTYTNAGHPPSLLFSPSEGKLTELGEGGVFLGQFPGVCFTEGCRKLAAGDRLMTFTDGIIEAADDQGRLYGRERLKQFMIDNVALTPAEFLEKLRLNLERNFNNADYLDDTTAVFVQVDCPGGRT
jgi:serine phosphatase RsbU (regulator of sigma subunit)